MPHQSAPCNKHEVKISFTITTQKWIPCLLNEFCLFEIAELTYSHKNVNIKTTPERDSEVGLSQLEAQAESSQDKQTTTDGTKWIF